MIPLLQHTAAIYPRRVCYSPLLLRCSFPLFHPPPSTCSHVTSLRVCFCTKVLVTCQKYLPFFFFLFCSSFLRRTNHSAWFPLPRALALKLFFIGKPDTWIQASKRSLCWFVRKILELSCISLTYTLSTPIDTTS